MELTRTDPDEIKENIPSIVDVQRIVVKRNNMEIKTNTLILTFNTPKIPESLKVCYLNIPVSQFVPNPLRYEYDIQSIRVSRNISFFEARQVYQKTHGQRVMSYAGATKAPIQSSSVCTQTCVSWVGPQPVTRRQHPAAPSTSRPLPSVSRSVGTTIRVVDVKKPVVATKSSPPKKDKKSNKPSSPKVSPVHESDAYFTVKTYKEKSKGSTPVTSVKISLIKFKTSILNKERLKRSYQASDFLPDVDISPSRSELMKNKVKKVEKTCFLKYIINDLGLMISLLITPSAPTSLMSH